MVQSGSASIVDHFPELKDPRIGRNRRHKLIDIVVLTVCAVISGCEPWEDIANYGDLKLEWLKRFLELPHGIPSHDTIRRLFIRLDPQSLQRCFFGWVEAMMRRMALSIMKRDTHSKRSLKGRRRICSYHDTYLEQLLSNSDETISQLLPG